MAKSAVNHNHLDRARTELELGMILSWRAANAAPALEWCWVTFGKQSRVISRECRRSLRRCRRRRALAARLYFANFTSGNIMSYPGRTAP
jgi:hypothetical protein